MTPTDVFERVQTLSRDVERLRSYMGRPRVDDAVIDVDGAAPREVIYQAATLCEKLNRLSYELIRESGDEPTLPAHDITPADVLGLIVQSHERVEAIADSIGIELGTGEPSARVPRTSTDVYMAVMRLTRQVNAMLDQRFAPPDVYEQVTLAIAHAASIRGAWPGRRIPPEPEWEFGKTPADVYRVLLTCLETLRSMASRADVEMLEFSADDTEINEVTPSDVYDLASLIVSEVAYLDRVLSDAPSRRRARSPGRKVPSDVFQRATMLGTQLEEIDALLGQGLPRKEGSP